MNVKKLMIAILWIGASAITGLQAQVLRNRLAVSLSRPGQQYSLEVRLVHGAISVSSYEGSEVLIEVSTEDKKEKGSGMHQVGPDEKTDIVAEENNNSIFVHSTHPGTLTNLKIKIPRQQARLKLTAVNEGDITVSNVNAALEVNNTNGAVRLLDVSGSVLASTVNGDITATFRSVDSNAPMAFSALTGNLDITLPAAFNGNARLNAEHGVIATDFALTPSPGNRFSKSPGPDGLTRLAAGGWIYGKISSGGPELQLSTSNGNVYLRKTRIPKK